jgi:cysteine desulfurase / selenocysteine lyase
MGFDIPRSQEIWRSWADEFPVRQNLVYLNHAAVAPLPRRCAAAMEGLSQDALHYGSLHYGQWLEAYEGLRVAAARLINAHRDEIAIVKNTSEGIATVALGLEFRPGDAVVLFREEFPANQYIWQRLEAKGVQLRWLSCEATLDQIEDACRGARLLAISFVQYLSGYRADLESIGRICRQHGTFFFVDAIQGMGAFPLDVRRCGIHALAADGHKWMLGPEGNGILFVAQEWQDRIEPIEFGWTTVAAFNDYSSRDMGLRTDAGRYECGTLNTITCFGLRASLELLLEAQVERIGEYVRTLVDGIAAGAAERGFEILGRRTPDHGAGIVCLRKPGVDARVTHARLRELGFTTAPRQGWVRVSPHFYISPDDAERFLDALSKTLV